MSIDDASLNDIDRGVLEWVRANLDDLDERVQRMFSMYVGIINILSRTIALTHLTFEERIAAVDLCLSIAWEGAGKDSHVAERASRIGVSEEVYHRIIDQVRK